MYYENIDSKIAEYLKSGDHVKLSVWRSIKNEFTKYKTASVNNILDDEKELQIISKMIQQRKDSIKQYREGNREDLALIEEKEVNVLQTLLPQEPTENDIIELIKEYKNNINNNITLKDTRNIIGYIQKRYPIVGGQIISKILREKFI